MVKNGTSSAVKETDGFKVSLSEHHSYSPYTPGSGLYNATGLVLSPATKLSLPWRLVSKISKRNLSEIELPHCGIPT